MSALIYDIGLHIGTDTAHYLRGGARVVAVDANPTMCEAAERKFSDYVRTGQLTVINRGLAEHSGQLEFWVCDDKTEWSSFNRSIASRDGARHHAVSVDCLPILDIVAEFGVPDYMKIDIEGNDRICIGGLTPVTAPRYISIEMDDERGDEDIRRLAELGYTNFKVICQNDGWRQATVRNLWFYQKLEADDFAIVAIRLLRKSAKRLNGVGLRHSSGPWGERTQGSWHSLEHALAVWRSMHEINQGLFQDGRFHRSSAWWFDVHASK